MGLLTADEYDAIRGALDVTLDADAIPDSVIEQLPFGPAAELWVLTQDPQAAGRTGTDRTHVLTALICYAAALIAPAVPNILSETQGSYAYSRAAVDWQERARELKGRASAAIAAVLTPGQTAARYPTMFTRAPGGRGV